jgi:formylglycine-generating enzyme required for sulfatase activity
MPAPAVVPGMTEPSLWKLWVLLLALGCSVDPRNFGRGAGGDAGERSAPDPGKSGASGDAALDTPGSEKGPDGVDPCASEQCVSGEDMKGAGGTAGTAGDDAGSSADAASPDETAPDDGLCSPSDRGDGNLYCIDGQWVEPPAGMVAVPAGAFSMGCDAAADASCGDDEYPYHTVWLDTFAIDRTEVRRGDYGLCVNAGACSNTPPSDDAGNPCNDDGLGSVFTTEHPVLCVSWYQAEAYCRWQDKRLPTEAEWEKAARGDDGRIYPWGDEPPSCTRAVMTGCRSDGLSGGPEPVGSKPAGASPYGALDMAGNAFEWVADWYEAAYYLRSPERNPPGPETGTRKITRSAAANYGGSTMRAAYRGPDYEVPTPDNRHVTVGFRCARTP